jgi:radical SAM superfamily enzyme YgiQ (UPF0313 family)
MKIALIITTFEGELPTFSTKPYSLLSLSSFLKSKNIESDIFDFTDVKISEKEINNSILEFGLGSYDLIGFSSYFENYESSKVWASELKKINKQMHITIGGYCPTIAHEYIIQNDQCFDSAVRGYGEMAFLQLIYSLSGNSSISDVSNLTYRTETKEIIINPFIEFEDLDKIGVINDIQVKNKIYEYAMIFDQKDNLWRTKVPIIATRGCPFPCFFCLNRVITKKYTFSPLQLVINEIESAIKGIDNPLITFWDPNFLIKEELFLGILTYLKKNQIPFTFGTTVSQLLKFRDKLDYLVDLGLRTLEVGIENVNDDINKLELGKVQVAKDCWELIDILSSKDIYCVVDFINYTAKSELEHIENNVNFLKYYYNIYPLQEYYSFGTFESQLCYYVGSKSFEILNKEKEIDYIPTKIYYSCEYFYHTNTELLFNYYKKFSNEYLHSVEEFYSLEFEKYQKNGVLEADSVQHKLKEIRDIPIYWYEEAFKVLKNQKKPKYSDIKNNLIKSHPNYKELLNNLSRIQL